MDEYKRNLAENIFTTIEMLHQPYIDVMMMPVKRFYDLLKWKADLEDQKAKLMKERSSKIETGPTRRK